MLGLFDLTIAQEKLFRKFEQLTLPIRFSIVPHYCVQAPLGDFQVVIRKGRLILQLSALAIVELGLFNVLTRRSLCLLMFLGGVESRQHVGLRQLVRGLWGSFLMHHCTLVQGAIDSWPTSPMFIDVLYLVLQSFKERAPVNAGLLPHTAVMRLPNSLEVADLSRL